MGTIFSKKKKSPPLKYQQTVIQHTKEAFTINTIDTVPIIDQPTPLSTTKEMTKESNQTSPNNASTRTNKPLSNSTTKYNPSKQDKNEIESNLNQKMVHHVKRKESLLLQKKSIHEH